MYRVISKVLLLMALVLYASKLSAQTDWKFEIVPYVWLTGIDADIGVRGREASVEVDADDLMDNVDVGGSFLTVSQYKRWVLWTQLDYFDLDIGDSNSRRSNADVEAEALFLTAAFGYQFRTFGQHSTLDVLGGVRYLNLDATVDDISSEGQEFVDAVIMFRPSFQLLSWLRFNPTMSIGAGDSNLTYETQPQFQFSLTDSVVARIGYRRLYYDVDGDRSNYFEGSFSGVLAGVGVAF